MEVTFNFTEEELIELSKLAYIARFVMDSSGEFSTDYKYPQIDIFYSTLREINKTVLLHLPDYKLLEVDEIDDDKFTHNYKMDIEMEQVIKAFSNDSLNSVVCSAVTKNEYKKQYPNLDIPEIIFDDSPYGILYNRNMKELEKNSLRNLWLDYE